MSRLLVTGGAGYIGAHTVVALVEAGFREIVIVDDLRRSDHRMLDGIETITGLRPILETVDVTDESALSDAFASHGPIDAVIHFAAYKSVRESVLEPVKYEANNVGGTACLLKAMRASGCSRMVFSSSCTVYGNPSALPVDEDTPIGVAQSPYGASKQRCEQLIRATADVGELSAAMSLRYFNAAGAHPSAHIGELPHGVPDFLVPFITQTAAGWREQLQVFGNDYNTPDGTAVRDYVHVDDLADAHVAAVAHLLDGRTRGFDAINLASGRGTTVLEAIAAFERATGVGVPYACAPRRTGDAEAIWARAERSGELLGWRTRRSLDEIMASAWAWQQSLPYPD